MDLLDVSKMTRQDIQINRLEENYPTKDHLIPLSRNGANNFDNLVLSCYTCNHTKADKTPEEFAPVGPGSMIDPAYRKWIDRSPSAAEKKEEQRILKLARKRLKMTNKQLQESALDAQFNLIKPKSGDWK